MFDAICVWMGGKPTVTLSENDSFGGPEAAAVIEMEFKGARCSVQLSRLGKLPNFYRIEGERGFIEGMVHEARYLTVSGASTSYRIARKEVDPKDLGGFLELPIMNFVQVLRGEADPLIPAHEVVHSIELIDEAYKRVRRFRLPWYEEKGVSDAA